MTKSEYKLHLREQVRRQKAFFESRLPGGLLAYLHKTGGPESEKSEKQKDTDPNDLKNKGGLAGAVYRAVIGVDGSIVPARTAVETAVEHFVRDYRCQIEQARTPDPGDAIPCMYSHWDIGWHTAAMAGLPPRFISGSWWLEPNLEWEAIEQLRFDADNPWLVVGKHVHRALWRLWDEDFWTMPFIHRSPLDYANGLRGTRLFMEMLTEPDKVKRLIDGCVDWQLQAEEFIYAGIDVPEGWGTGIMGTWGPDKAVWVNGDPVGLISREMMREFEQPYTGRLFTSTGGGFFHNHTLGLYQADRVAETPGIHMQNFTKDANKRTVEDTLLEDPTARERIIAASLKTPILISGMNSTHLQALLPIVSKGRFILDLETDTETELTEIGRSIRNAGKIE